MLEGVGVEEGSRAGTRLWQTPVWPAPRAALSFPLETPAPRLSVQVQWWIWRQAQSMLAGIQSRTPSQEGL